LNTGFEPILVENNKSEIILPEDGKIALSAGALQAAKYILSCDAKKLFSFSLSKDALKELSKKTEYYMLAHLDRKFRTLDYYQAVR